MFLLHPGDNYTERVMWQRGLRAEAGSIGRLTLLVVGKRALVFDVGANCGAFTLPLATAAAAASRIVAFEPNPVMAARLRTNLALNRLTDSVDVVEVAIGAQDGEAPRNLVERNLGRATLRPIDSISSMPVAVRRLAQYLPEHSHRYETVVVKIDVEGYEDEVLVPFLTTIPGECMPDAILLKTDHDQLWGADVKDVLKELSYVPFFEGEEQNTLFTRPVDAVPEGTRALKRAQAHRG